jgi:hypothetical protein
MMDQSKAAQSATAAAVFVSEALKEEGLAAACQWYAIAESYAGANTWEERKAFHKLFESALKRNSFSKKRFNQN